MNQFLNEFNVNNIIFDTKNDAKNVYFNYKIQKNFSFMKIKLNNFKAIRYSIYF